MHIIKKIIVALVVASKEVGLAVNVDKTKYSRTSIIRTNLDQR